LHIQDVFSALFGIYSLPGTQQPMYLSAVLKTCKVAVRQSLPNKIRSTLGSDDTPNSLSEAIILLEVVTTAAVLVRNKCVRIHKEAVRNIDRSSCHHNQLFVVVSNTTYQLLIGLFFTTTDICSYSACISPRKSAYELGRLKQYHCHHYKTFLTWNGHQTFRIT